MPCGHRGHRARVGRVLAPPARGNSSCCADIAAVAHGVRRVLAPPARGNSSCRADIAAVAHGSGACSRPSTNSSCRADIPIAHGSGACSPGSEREQPLSCGHRGRRAPGRTRARPPRERTTHGTRTRRPSRRARERPIAAAPTLSGKRTFENACVCEKELDSFRRASTRLLASRSRSSSRKRCAALSRTFSCRARCARRSAVPFSREAARRAELTKSSR